MRPFLAALVGCVLIASCAEAPPGPSPREAAARSASAGPVPARPQWSAELYDAPRSKGSCRLQPLEAGSRSSMEAYLEDVSGCLDRIWTRTFDAMGVPFLLPGRRWLSRQSREGQCGKVPGAAAVGAYCGANRTYYVLIETAELGPEALPWAVWVTAHEYAHHVQSMTGIMGWFDGRSEAAGKRARTLLHRRLELQADCLAGAALHAMKGPLPPWPRFQELAIGAEPGDPAGAHGRVLTQMRWLTKGFRTGRPGACDTWSVPASEVT